MQGLSFGAYGMHDTETAIASINQNAHDQAGVKGKGSGLCLQSEG